MRNYEGTARLSYEHVLRSMGALLDQRGMREITVTETDDGFVVQGLAPAPLEKETFHLHGDDLTRFMDEAQARRQGRQHTLAHNAASGANASFYESALRVLGAYLDQQQPRDVSFFEQDHQFVMRLLMSTRAGLRHVLVEFTRDEVEAMIAAGQQGRGR